MSHPIPRAMWLLWNATWPYHCRLMHQLQVVSEFFMALADCLVYP